MGSCAIAVQLLFSMGIYDIAVKLLANFPVEKSLFYVVLESYFISIEAVLDLVI